LSDFTKKVISEKAKKRFEKESEREKLRISNKKFEDSKTSEQKIKDILIQDSKFVIQYDKEMNFISEFISIRDAERKTNINRSNISKCCKNKVKSAGGLYGNLNFQFSEKVNIIHILNKINVDEIFIPNIDSDTACVPGFF
jgi:hypothetical protein